MGEYLVLLVEDNDSDFDLTEIALQSGVRDFHLYRVADGEQAIDFLQNTGKFIGMPRPGLVLLDLHLPKKDGFEVLEWCRAQTSLHNIPVIMFTTSSRTEDIDRALSLGANEFITKPINLDQLVISLKTVCAKYMPQTDEPGLAISST